MFIVCRDNETACKLGRGEPEGMEWWLIELKLSMDPVIGGSLLRTTDSNLLKLTVISDTAVSGLLLNLSRLLSVVRSSVIIFTV